MSLRIATVPTLLEVKPIGFGNCLIASSHPSVGLKIVIPFLKKIRIR
jgi:hypothetical protein